MSNNNRPVQTIKKSKIVTYLVVLAFLLCSCSEQSEVMEELTQNHETIQNTVTLDPSSEESATVTTETEFSLSDVTGIYLMKAKNPQEGDPIAFRLELRGEGDKLGVLFTEVQVMGEQNIQAEIVDAKVGEKYVTAEYKGFPYSFKVSSDGKTADVTSCWSDGNSSSFTGQYDRQSPEEEYCPEAIPEALNDPDTPNGAVDAVLAKVARNQLGLPEDAILTTELLAQVRELEIAGEESVSLNGIELFTGLRSIWIQSSYIKDISPLAGLSSLTDISFDQALIDTIPDFSKCENLTRLSLTICGIKDITPVTKIKSLKSLILTNNRITSIAPIKDMDTLWSLDVSGNPITDWEAIADNEKLVKALCLEYDFDLELSVLDKAREIVKEVVTDDMSELEKEIAIYKKIQDIADYDFTNSCPASKKPGCYYTLMEGRGLCGDFSNTVSLLMNLAGLECFKVLSGPHAWNIIRIDGDYYEIDCTWDDLQAGSPLDWLHFNVSRAYMDAQGEHHILKMPYPIAPRTMMRLEYLMLIE